MAVVRNAGPFDATIEHIEPVWTTSGAVLDAVYLGRPGKIANGLGPTTDVAQAFVDGASVADALEPLPLTLAPTADGDIGRLVFVNFHATDPGLIAYRGIRIDYRIGPFTFRVVQHLGGTFCLGPMPPNQDCAMEAADS